MLAIFLDVIIGDDCLYEVKRRLQAITGPLLCPLKTHPAQKQPAPYSRQGLQLHAALHTSRCVRRDDFTCGLLYWKPKKGEGDDLPLILTI